MVSFSSSFSCRRRTSTTSLLFLVTVLVSVWLSVASFSPSPSGRRHCPGCGATNTNTFSKSESKSSATKSKTYQHSRLYEKSAPEEEETTQARIARAVASYKAAKAVNDNDDSVQQLQPEPGPLPVPYQQSVPESDEKQPDQQQKQQQDAVQLQSQLLSKDAMYQNQIDALRDDATGEIKEYENHLTQLETEYRQSLVSMTDQLSSTQVSALEKEHALMQEITTLLASLEEEKQAGQGSLQRAEQLEQERTELQEQLAALQVSYADTIHDLEDAYELEQNARSKEQASHVQEMLQLEQQSRAGLEEAERQGLEATEQVRSQYIQQFKEKEQEIETIKTKLKSVKQSLRDREDLIAEWAADRASAKALTRQLWQLLKGRVLARADRVTTKFKLWFSDDAPLP
jgi:DNA repair exonuclease SbcCD ATPase subunit